MDFKELVVVELASVLAGPAVGMFFAELGAKVIKIENKKTKGDITRNWKLSKEDPKDEFSAYYHSINWGKEKRMLDLQNDTDYQSVMELIKTADIVISNFKGDSALKLKMDYNNLKAAKPDLIYASVSAYGDDNPAPGFDAMIQAETGWVHMTGEQGGAPVKMPVALIDILAAHQLKQGVLMALLKRQSTGEGSFVSISLYDASLAALANQASNWLNARHLPQRMGTQHPNIAPYGDVFYTKDNVGIMLGTGTQKQFENLCHCLALSTLVDDARFLTNSMRLRNRVALNEYLNKAFGERNFAIIEEEFKAKGVTMARINNLEEVFNQEAAKRLVLEETLEDGRVAKSVRTAVFRIVSSQGLT